MKRKMSSIEEKYFLILKDYFSDLSKWIQKKRKHRVDIVNEIFKVYSPELMSSILESLTADLLNLNWDSQTNKLKKIGGTKTAYLGDAYSWKKEPAQTFDFLKKTSLYADTTIIKDSILSEALAYEDRKTGEEISFSLIAQHALNLIKIEDLFSSDLDPPICFLAPSSVLTLKNEGKWESTNHLINDKIVPFYCSEVFGKSYESSEEFIDYIEKFKSFEEINSVLKKSNIVFYDVDGKQVSAKEKFSTIKEYYEGKYETSLSLSQALFLFVRSKYSWLPWDLISTRNLTSNYVTDFRGLWDSYLDFLKKDNEVINECLGGKLATKDTLIMQALQQQDFNWLGRVPLDKIKTLREMGELGEMREVLGKNIDEIKNAKDAEFAEVVTQISHSLNEQFRRHDHEVNQLDKTFRRKYKINVSTLVVSGSLAIASAIYPPIAWHAGFSSSLFGSYSIKGLIGDFLEKREKNEVLQQKPIAMLFDAKNTNDE